MSDPGQLIQVLQNLSVPDVAIAEKVIRPIIVYVFLVLFLRIFGKRELAQLNPFDLVVLMCLANTVQNAIIGNDNSVSGGIIGAFALLGFNYLVVRYLFRHRRLDQIFEGRPVVLVENGQLCQGAMARELLTTQEILTAAHRQGFRRIGEIKRMVLEPGGTFFIERADPEAEQTRFLEVISRLDRIEKLLSKPQG